MVAADVVYAEPAGPVQAFDRVHPYRSRVFYLATPAGPAGGGAGHYGAVAIAPLSQLVDLRVFEPDPAMTHPLVLMAGGHVPLDATAWLVLRLDERMHELLAAWAAERYPQVGYDPDLVSPFFRAGLVAVLWSSARAPGVLHVVLPFAAPADALAADTILGLLLPAVAAEHPDFHAVTRTVDGSALRLAVPRLADVHRLLGFASSAP